MDDNSKNKKVHKLTAIGLLVTLGIVFGDIGTSPLYVMKTIMHANAGYDANYIIGAVSCVIWTLTLQTSVKYVMIALTADNNGEGGILALYALLRKSSRKWLYVVAIIGACTLVADGIITPSITVVTAIEGLEAINPDTPVVPITIAIITVIFFVQQFGTSTIGKFFGPFMFLWFLMMGLLGCSHIIQYLPILKAFNPYYAINLLAHNPNWFLILGAVFLCTTGAEALYSDLGHCGKKNITISWIYVKVMLILNYLGQGAWIISNIGKIGFDVNPFYAIMPHGFLVIGIIMATGAAIIASQALISGSFTIFSEAMNLDFWPNLRIKYPTNVKGQLYIPSVNIFLYVFCVLTILTFRTSGHMEAAYGLSITITMLMTTILLTFYLKINNINKLLIGMFFFFFVTVEGCFLTANLFKFVHGGWFTIMIAGIFCTIMFVWYKAYTIRKEHLKFKKTSDYYSILSDIKRDTSIPKYASNLIYINRNIKKNEIEDKLIYSIINKQPKRADHYWLFHIDHLDEPNTLEYTFTPLIDDTLFNINIRVGFRIQPCISLYLRQIIEDLTKKHEFDITSSYPALKKYNIAGDFKFVVIHRIYYPASSNNSHNNLIMNIYSIIKHFGITEERALGLDTSNVVVEKVPLIINNTAVTRRIRRVFPKKDICKTDKDD
nr:KUP/HAK/KT family potassium transporter [Prevotella sp.]